MNRTKPNFLENTTLNSDYYEKPNPYVNAPSCHVNLLELSRYARQSGKGLAELTQEELLKYPL